MSYNHLICTQSFCSPQNVFKNNRKENWDKPLAFYKVTLLITNSAAQAIRSYEKFERNQRSETLRIQALIWIFKLNI